MGLALPFARHKSLVEESSSELNVTFDEKRNSFDKLIEFCEEMEPKRVNVKFIGVSGVNPRLAKTLCKTCGNAYMCLEASDAHKMPSLRESGVRYYMDANNPCCSFTELNAMCELGVSDVYVADDLCYSLRYVRDILDEYDVRLRWVLNKIPLTYVVPAQANVPFFRPQDMGWANLYVDTYELDCGSWDAYDWKRAQVLYDTWFVKHKWQGDIGEIVEGMPVELFNPSLPREYCVDRLNCHLRCVKGGRCKKCFQYAELADKLSDMGVMFKNE